MPFKLPNRNYLAEAIRGPVGDLLEILFPPDDLGIAPVAMADEVVKPAIRGFTSFGGKVIDLSPTRVTRKVGKDVIAEAPQSIARIIEDSEAAKALDRILGNTTSKKLESYTADKVTDAADLAHVQAKGPAQEAPKKLLRNLELGRQSGVKRAKLNESMVRMIRESAAKGVTQDALAKEWGVSQNTINAIVNRMSWAWVK